MGKRWPIAGKADLMNVPLCALLIILEQKKKTILLDYQFTRPASFRVIKNAQGKIGPPKHIFFLANIVFQVGFFIYVIHG